MQNKFSVMKQIPVRMSVETYNKFVNMADRFGMSQQHILKNLVESWIEESETRIRALSERVENSGGVEL